MIDHRHPPVALRLEPHAIPAMRAGFEYALNALGPQLVRLRQVGHLQEAWLGDEVSESVEDYYNAPVMEGLAAPLPRATNGRRGSPMPADQRLLIDR